MDVDYCPHCGANVLIQRKIEYLSKYFYNQGLEKASIRDLSGAITCLKQSLSYNKRNIAARNLLGLVYFETGEVVAALSEWVISKNLQPGKNLASEYINKLQANPNKLEAINETIKKYNHALALCRAGHEDMAAISLKKILAQNSKLIKGYHLLALIQMKEHEWNRARRTLRKAARIDKTNTTTLRFLREIDEQTGVSTRLEQQNKKRFRVGGSEKESYISDIETPTQTYKEHPRVSLFFTLALGFAAGAAAFWFLVMPAIRQGIYKEANEQIVTYSEYLSSQGVELNRAQDEAEQSVNTAEQMTEQIELERATKESYAYLLEAYAYLQQGDADSAYLSVREVNTELLAEDAMKIYDTITEKTGVPVPTSEPSEESESSDSESEDTGYEESGYEESGYEDSDYSDSDYSDSDYSDWDEEYEEY
jgi:tetratricopeptide (TPR) repeat protein